MEIEDGDLLVKARRQVRFADELPEDGTSSAASSADEVKAPNEEDGLNGTKPFKPLLKRRSRRRKTAARAKEVPDEDSPDVVAAQFRWARKSKDYDLMAKVLARLENEPEDSPLRKRIGRAVLDEALLYAMLSRNRRFTDMLIGAGASVAGADRMYNDARGDLSTCDCGSHPGMLLITLVRQSSHQLIDVALDELSVNSYICDGDTQRMWWGTGYSFQGLQPVKTPILKSQVLKTTPLSAAVANNDLHIIETLVARGADISAHDCLAFSEAAKQIDDRRHRLLRYLFGRITSLPNFGSEPRVMALFEMASAAALRAAAENGDAEKLRFVIELIEAEQEWASGTRGQKPASVFKDRKPIGHGMSGRQLYEPADNHSSLSSTSSWATQSSSSSGGSLAPNSMERHLARRQSHHVIKPLLDGHAISGYRSPQAGSSSSKRGRGHAQRGKGGGGLLERALTRAINGLIEDGADPQHADRRGLSRALEGLSMLDTQTLRERREDLFAVFLATLSQSGPTAENSALALLDCGLEEFLASGENGTGARAKPKAPREKQQPAPAPAPAPAPTSDADAGAASTGSSTSLARPKPRRSAWGRIKQGIAKSLPGVGGHLGSRQRTLERRASSDDKMKALTIACEGGHAGVLERLLSKVDADSLEIVAPRLLCVAAKNNSFGLMSVLLPYLGAKNTDALNSAFRVALENQSFEFAYAVIERGAKPTSTVFVEVLCSASTNHEYRLESCDELFHIVSELEIKFVLDDARKVLDVSTTATAPNLESVLCLLDFDESLRAAVCPTHLLNVVRASTNDTDNNIFQEFLAILITCMGSAPGLDEAITAAYEEAVAQTKVHPGVLTVLMDKSGHHDQEETWV